MLLSVMTFEQGLWSSSSARFFAMPRAEDKTFSASDGSRAEWITAMRAANTPKLRNDSEPEVNATQATSMNISWIEERPLSFPSVEVRVQYSSNNQLLKPSTATECFSRRDYGVIGRLANSTRQFCTEPTSESAALTSMYTHFSVGDADLMATAFRYLRLDLRRTSVAHDITELSEDGGGHDPRFTYASDMAQCSCNSPQDAQHGAPRVWRFFLAADPSDEYVACSQRTLSPSNWSSADLVVQGRHVVLLGRKDDHNPFFQLSATFNAWILTQAAGWAPEQTQLVFLDKGIPTPIDELQRVMLGPNYPAIRGEQVLGKVLHLESAMVAPVETSGPLMTHLNDKQPCGSNQLLAEFRRTALDRMNVSSVKQNATNCLVTVISRRPYGGRMVQRVWRNEDEILDHMRAEYGGRCHFQSLDFVDLPMAEQMRVMVESDVVIGMHGAGMVNVAWTRPGTLVVEIFPRYRFRWGYRNLCQFLGCEWHEFRRGNDLSVGGNFDPNAMDKSIEVAQWSEFFNPLFQRVLTDLQTTFNSTT